MLNSSEIFNNAMSSAEDFADKDHAAGILEDAMDAMKGLVTAELRADGQPVTLIPNLVKNDERYKEASRLWRDARKVAMIAKFKYDQVCVWQDNERTNEVTTRRLTS